MEPTSGAGPVLVRKSLLELGPSLPPLGRRAIVEHLQGRATEPEAPWGAPAPVFVTLRDYAGELRGCIGGLVPSEPSLEQEVVRSAVLAATRDPRFQPVTWEEVSALSVEVSVLFPEEFVAEHQVGTGRGAGAAQLLSILDPERFGIVVRERQGPRRGVMLPGVEGLHEPAEQLRATVKKAGFSVGDRVRVSRFQVMKFAETR